jgi:hypothetical protein
MFKKNFWGGGGATVSSDWRWRQDNKKEKKQNKNIEKKCEKIVDKHFFMWYHYCIRASKNTKKLNLL